MPPKGKAALLSAANTNLWKKCSAQQKSIEFLQHECNEFGAKQIVLDRKIKALMASTGVLALFAFLLFLFSG